MKATLLTLATTFAITAFSQETGKKVVETTANGSTESKGTYDPELAAKLGADDYGMRHYVIAFLKMGPNRDQDSTNTAEVMRGHMDNIQRMADMGKLAVAGPFLDNGDLRGIYVFNVETVEEAEALTKTDPAIQSGYLVMELHPWYGSAAMVEVAERHKLVAKKQF